MGYMATLQCRLRYFGQNNQLTILNKVQKFKIAQFQIALGLVAWPNFFKIQFQVYCRWDIDVNSFSIILYVKSFPTYTNKINKHFTLYCVIDYLFGNKNG